MTNQQMPYTTRPSPAANTDTTNAARTASGDTRRRRATTAAVPLSSGRSEVGSGI